MVISPLPVPGVDSGKPLPGAVVDIVKSPSGVTLSSPRGFSGRGPDTDEFNFLIPPDCTGPLQTLPLSQIKYAVPTNTLPVG